MEEIERQEARDVLVVIGKVKDEGVRKRLREQDDQEDFLDEGMIRLLIGNINEVQWLSGLLL